MGKRKRASEYIRKSFETRVPGAASSTGEKIVGLCWSQLSSDAWRNLRGGAVNLYVFMRLQYDGTNDSGFSFNKSLYTKRYGLYSSATQFEKDLKQLIENGFVDLVESGRLTRTKSIYRFSDRWQTVKRRKKDMSAANEARAKKVKNG